MALKYQKYGRVWSVLQADCGSFYIGSKRPGWPPAVLDRIGTSRNKREMEIALHRWAQRNGAFPVGKDVLKQMRLI